MAVPPEWLSPLLSSIAILVAIVGWFIVNQLDRGRARREHAYRIKSEAYAGIIASLHRLSLIVGVWETLRSVDVSNVKQRQTNSLKLSTALTMIPDDEAMDRVANFVEDAREGQEALADPIQAAREEPTEEQEERAALEVLREAIDAAAAIAFVREIHQLRDASVALILFDVPDAVREEVQAVINVMMERPTQAWVLEVAELAGLSGIVEMGELKDWQARANEAMIHAIKTLRKDLAATI